MWAAPSHGLGTGLNKKSVAACIYLYPHPSDTMPTPPCWCSQTVSLDKPHFSSNCFCQAFYQHNNHRVIKEHVFKTIIRLLPWSCMTIMIICRKPRQEVHKFWLVMVIHNIIKQKLWVWLSYMVFVMYVQGPGFDSHHWIFLQPVCLIHRSGTYTSTLVVRRDSSMPFCNQGNRLHSQSSSGLGKEDQMR